MERAMGISRLLVWPMLTVLMVQLHWHGIRHGMVLKYPLSPYLIWLVPAAG